MRFTRVYLTFNFSSISRRKIKRASIFLIASWLMVIFGFFAVALYKITYAKLNIVERNRDLVESQYAAENLVAFLQAELKNNNFEFLKKYGLGKENKKVIGEVSCEYLVLDESSKINLNTATAQVLSRLAAIEPKFAENIYLSKLKPFEVKEKLLLVKGIDRQKLADISAFTTVYGNGKVNINSVSSKVLEALDFSRGTIEAIMAYRADGKSFVDIKESVEFFRSAISGTITNEDSNKLPLLLSANSEAFELRLTSKVLGKQVMEYDIIFNAKKILRWQER